MRSLRLIDSALLTQGTCSGVRFDPLAGSLARQGSGALVNDVATPGVMGDVSTTGTLAGSWDAGTSPRALNSTATWTYTTTAYAVDINVAAQSGGIGYVAVDGQPRGAFDSNRAPSYRVYLDGKLHTIVLSFRGTAVISTPSLVGAPTDTSGTAGLAAALTATRNGAATITDTFSVTATSPTSVTMRNAAAVVQGTLAAGQSSDTLIPGVTLSLRIGTWDATSVARVQTNAATMRVQSITTYPGMATSAVYVSPVFDSGETGTQWPLVELTQGPLGTSPPLVVVRVGDTPTPDASWTTAVPATSIVTVPDTDGHDWQRVVYAGSPNRGRYCQVTGSLVSTSYSWVGDIRVFMWRPESDAFLTRLPREVYRGAVAVGVLAALAAFAAYLDEQADEALGAGSIATAIGPYLSALGTQQQQPRLLGESDATYRQRLSVFLAGKNQGGSQPFLQKTISGALGCPCIVSPRGRSAGGFTLGATPLGVSGLGKTTSGPWRWGVQVPLSQLKVPPDTAVTIINQLRPTGSIVAVQFT